MNEPLVVIEGAGRTFAGRAVLTGVDLRVAPGELIGVVGPNGGGKSTLLMLLAGLLAPSTGRVRIGGIDACALSLAAAGRVGLVTARPGLYPLLTGRENLWHFGGLFGLSPREVDERAAPLVQALGLGAGFDERVGRMSTGMQQKVSLVRALLLAPPLLLLDEPTANLDPLVARALYAEVRRRVDAGLACVLVTHDLSAAEAVCDRVLIVNGRVERELRFPDRRAPHDNVILQAWRALHDERPAPAPAVRPPPGGHLGPLLRIARTELLEHQRQPWMVLVLALNYLIWVLIFGVVFLSLADPATAAEARTQLAAAGVGFDATMALLVSTFGSLVFTNLPLYVAIMSGTSVIHDRESGTMPFLLLAPVTRGQLLAGKLLGAMGFPMLFHLLFVGGSCLLFGRLPLLEPYATTFGGTSAWWIGFLVGAPASAAFVGALGTVISALSRDVRTSMQYTSFFVGLLSLGFGYALVDALPQGAGVQVEFAAGCAIAAVITLLVGVRLINRDGMAS